MGVVKDIGAICASLCASAGSGLRQLLESQSDLDEAAYSCASGLLATYRLSAQQLRAAGMRLLQDAISPLEKP